MIHIRELSKPESNINFEILFVSPSKVTDIDFYDEVKNILIKETKSKLISRNIIHAGWNDSIEETIFNFEELEFKVFYDSTALHFTSLILLNDPTETNKNKLRAIADIIIKSLNNKY